MPQPSCASCQPVAPRGMAGRWRRRRTMIGDPFSVWLALRREPRVVCTSFRLAASLCCVPRRCSAPRSPMVRPARSAGHANPARFRSENRAADKSYQEFATSAPGPPRVCALLARRSLREGMTMSYVDVAIPAIAGLLALAWPQMFLRKPADELKVRRIRLFGLLFLAIAAAYLAMRLAGV